MALGSHATLFSETYPGVVAKLSLLPNAGLGLFATQEFHQGDSLGEYVGNRLTECEKRLLCDKSNLFKVSDDLFLDPRDEKMLMRYMNHHFDPENQNAKFEIRGEKVFVIVTRNIKAGEEIYISYGGSYWMAASTEEFRDMTPEPATVSLFCFTVNGDIISEVPRNILSIIDQTTVQIHDEDAFARFNSIVGYMIDSEASEIDEWECISIWECRNDKDQNDLAAFLLSAPEKKIYEPSATGILGEDFTGMFDVDDIQKIADITQLA